MLDAINAFLLNVNARDHVLSLVQTKDFVIQISGQHDLLFKNGKVEWLQTNDTDKVTYLIDGDYRTLCQLLEGREPLRKLVREGTLQIIAPFRTVLLLESIFYLTKPLKKII
jgi:hypothetical protein